MTRLPSAAALLAKARSLACATSQILVEDSARHTPASGAEAAVGKQNIMRSLSVVAVLVLGSNISDARGEYPIKDSQRRVSDLARIFWVDEQRLLFSGFNGREVLRSDGHRVLLQSLYVWDLKTGTVEDHGDVAAGLCYANGYVRYRKWKQGEIENLNALGDIVAGPLGRQAKIDEDLKGGKIDSETCQAYREPPALPDWTKDRNVLRLRPGPGFLVLGPQRDDRNTPMTYYADATSPGVLLPFRRREIRAGSVRYIPFKGAYFIEGDYFVADPSNPLSGYNKSPWPKGVPVQIWWLYEDGRVDGIKLPTETRFGDRIFPAKTGIFYLSPDYIHDNDGLFEVAGGSAKRVAKGFVQGYAVSPNGCGIAMNLDPRFTGKRGQGSVQVVDTCAKGK